MRAPAFIRNLRYGPPTLRLYSATVNGYRSSQLQGCDRDGENMVLYLEPRGFEVHRLREGDVTGQNLEAFWREGVARTGPRDLTVFHFSGHGFNGPSGKPDDPGQGILMQDMRPFYAGRIAMIMETLMVQGQAYVFLDSCHSETGTFNAPLGVRSRGDGYRSVKSVPWSMVDTSQDPVPTRLTVSLRMLTRTTTFPLVEFAACQANDVTYDAQINGVIQGCYTRAVLDAAKELDAQHPRRGYSVGMFQKTVRTKLPSPDYPNQPQLQASDWQRRWKMWAADQVR